MRNLFKSAVILVCLWTAAVSAAPHAEPIEWKLGDQTFSGYLVYDATQNAARPGLLMVPDWFGVTDDAVTKAKQLAGDDYVVLVVDMYGEGIRPQNPEQALAQIKTLYANPIELRARINQALVVLRAQSSTSPVQAQRIAALGYCFGGSTVLELARSGADIAGVVTFHGGLETAIPAVSGTVKASILVLNGAEDKNVAPHIAGFEQEMNAAAVDWQFVNFSGAVHCFALENANRPPGCVYNARAAKRAYGMADDFLDEVFRD